MKKTLAVLTLIAVGVFFCIPVNASTYISIANSKVATANNNNVYCEFRAVQLKGPLDEYVQVANYAEQQNIVSHMVVLVQVKFTNYNNYPCTVRSFAPRFVFADGTNEVYRRVVNIENYTDEMYLTITNSSSYFDITPSVYFVDGSLVNVPPHGSITALARVEMVCELPVNSTMGSMNFSYGSISSLEFYQGGFIAEQTSVYPKGTNIEIQMTLEDILEQLQGNASTNADLEDESDTIASQSESVHYQEAAYYAQNSAAIEATGLSNYQFDASAVSGLTGVRGDFIDIWNSLGSWNSVYIFSLTLGLALTILRHSPSAISSAIRRRSNSKNDGGS